MAIIMTEGFKLTLTEIDGLILTEDNVIITAENNEGTQFDDE
jgi:hypothetical protein